MHALAQTIRGGQVPNSSHWIPEERPDFNKTARQFPVFDKAIPNECRPGHIIIHKTIYDALNRHAFNLLEIIIDLDNTGPVKLRKGNC